MIKSCPDQYINQGKNLNSRGHENNLKYPLLPMPSKMRLVVPPRVLVDFEAHGTPHGLQNALVAVVRRSELWNVKLKEWKVDLKRASLFSHSRAHERLHFSCPSPHALGNDWLRVFSQSWAHFISCGFRPTRMQTFFFLCDFLILHSWQINSLSLYS